MKKYPFLFCGWLAPNGDFTECSHVAVEVIEGLMRFCKCFAQHHTDDIRYTEAQAFLSKGSGI